MAFRIEGIIVQITKWIMCVVCVGALSLGACGAEADVEALDANLASADFTEGRLNTQFYGQTYHDFDDDVTYDMGTFALEYFIDDDFALGTEFSGWDVSQGGGSDTSAVGIQLMPRFYLMHKGGFSVFYEIGAGVMYAQDHTPMPNGTTFNFTAATGFGVKWRITENVSFFGGGRYLHLSNMNRHGPDRNPSFDGAGGFGGLQIDF